MTDKTTATERLRQLLDERGVEWDYGITGTATTRFNANGVDVTFTPMRDGLVCSTILSPEQAVEATLGRGTCKYDFVPNIGNGFLNACGLKCSCCGREQMSLDAPKFCPNCGRMVEE